MTEQAIPTPANENIDTSEKSEAVSAASTEAAETEAAPGAEAAPRPARRRLDMGRSWGLASVAIVSFSLTFAAGGMALLAGILPTSVAAIEPPVDLGVLMLMVPVCALVLAMLAEVARAAIAGIPRVPPPRPVVALSSWRPGRDG